MRRSVAPVALAVAIGLVAPTTAGAAEGVNGYVMMVHATSEPRVNDTAPFFVPPVPEAVLATRDRDVIAFHVIPHGLDGRPVQVSDARLEIVWPSGSKRVLRPNASPATARICGEETSYAGFEGPIQACLVFRVPASAFAPTDAVTLTLRFRDASGAHVEPYDVAAHGLLHSYQQGAPVDLRDVDETLTAATPFVVESAFDPKP